MMRVAYVIPFDVTHAQGLLDRTLDRVEYWRDSGVDVELFICTSDGHEVTEEDLHAFPLHRITGKTSATATWGLAEELETRDFDICYLRYGLPYPGLIKLARRIPTVLEIHAHDLREARHRPWFYGALARALGASLFTRSRGVVFVDPDLLHLPRFESIPGPRMVITNGIRLRSDVPYGERRVRRSGPIRFVLGAGADEPWQGIDKYCEIARALPDMEFHLAGAADLRAVPDNVIRHGKLGQDEFEELLAGVDIGVGNLALERIDRPRPSPLKVREYVRHGLPCVIAHEDPDLIADDTLCELPYGFAVAPDIVQTLRQFGASACGRTVSKAAADSVRFETKEDARLNLLRSVIGA